MVAGILTSGVAQAIRVAEVGANATTDARDQEMRFNWFRETISLSMLPPYSTKRAPDAQPLIGEPMRVSGISLYVPGGQSYVSNELRISGTSATAGAAITRQKSYAPAAYQFQLKFNPDRGTTALQIQPESTAFGEQSAPIALAEWEGSNGRFRYLDEDNQWQDVWPVVRLVTSRAELTAKAIAPMLPKAIELRYGTPAKSIIVAILDRAPPPPSMLELMQ